MRHRKSRLRLTQKPGHARMLQRNLVTSLLLYESIRTTKKRALVVRPIVERLVTAAKTKEPHLAIRSINRVVTDKNASRKIMQVFAKRYADRPSGIVRMVPAGLRKGDGAELVDLQFIDAVIGGEVVPGKEKKQTARKKPAAKKSPASSLTSEASAKEVASSHK